MVRRSVAAQPPWINHASAIVGSPAILQRIQISVSAITAIANSPTNRIMMVPILGGVLRNGMGPVV
jgi:hypothetical protein